VRRACGIFFFFFFFFFFFTVSANLVDGGQRAVIFDRFSGVKKSVVGEGTHLLIPFIQKPIIFEVRTQYHEVATHTGSRDLQTVEVALRVLYKPDVAMLPTIFR
jgi:prohibitin 1